LYTAVLADLPQDSFDFIATRKAFQHLDDRAEMKGASYLIQNFAVPVFSQVFVATHKQTAQAALLQEAVAQIRKRNFDQPELILKGNRYTDLDDKPLKFIRLLLIRRIKVVFRVNKRPSKDRERRLTSPFWLKNRA
jgi:hypothetical protein